MFYLVLITPYELLFFQSRVQEVIKRVDDILDLKVRRETIVKIN